MKIPENSWVHSNCRREIPPTMPLKPSKVQTDDRDPKDPRVEAYHAMTKTLVAYSTGFRRVHMRAVSMGNWTDTSQLAITVPWLLGYSSDVLGSTTASKTQQTVLNELYCSWVKASDASFESVRRAIVG